MHINCICNWRTIFYSSRFLASFIISSNVMPVQSLMFCDDIILCFRLDFVSSISPISIFIRTSSCSFKCFKNLHFPFPILFTKRGFFQFLAPFHSLLFCCRQVLLYHLLYHLQRSSMTPQSSRCWLNIIVVTY